MLTRKRKRNEADGKPRAGAGGGPVVSGRAELVARGTGTVWRSTLTRPRAGLLQPTVYTHVLSTQDEDNLLKGACCY